MERSNSPSLDIGSDYPDAKAFFEASAPTALTFDDVSLATRYSEVLPRSVRLQTQLSERLSLEIPILSSDMDTVTEAEMATALALNGGLGLIHYNLSTRDQLREVSRVKNHVHGLIQEPITVSPDLYIAEVLEEIERRRFKFRTFPVVDQNQKLLGLLSGRVVKERYRGRTVREAMTARDQVYTLAHSALGNDPIGAADRFFDEHMGIHKLLVVDDDDHLHGLFTLSDVERISEEDDTGIRPARDADFRLVCGAAIHAKRTPEGSLDRDAILEHVGSLVERGVDAIAISTAHGHTQGVGEATRLIRDAHPELTLIAGNVTSGEGVRFLAEAGADAIKIGQGPGSICTTRVVAGVGIPQLSALYVASREASKIGVRLLADGGITKSGDIVKALTLSDAVICGSLLAGCAEAPGKVIEIDGKLYKEYRGMGSVEAMRSGSAARYGQSSDRNAKLTAEGIEALKEVSGSADRVLGELVGGLQSGMGYLGANDLAALKERARYVRVTAAGRQEAAPHDVIQVKTTQEDRVRK